MQIERETNRGHQVVASGLCNVVRVDKDGTAVLQFGDGTAQNPVFAVTLSAVEVRLLAARLEAAATYVKQMQQEFEDHLRTDVVTLYPVK